MYSIVQRNRLATLGGLMLVISIGVVLLLFGLSTALAGGENGEGTGPSGDPPIAVDAGWSATTAVPPAFFRGGAGAVFSPSIFTYTSATSTTVSVTDDFCKGDQFRIFDFGVLIGDTSVVPSGACTEVGPDAAFADPSYSSGTFGPLPPGSHSITIQVIVNPFEGGRGYIRVDSCALCTKELAIDTLQPHAGDFPGIAAAIQQIQLSLFDQLWIDESHLDTAQGFRVFRHEKDAVLELRRVFGGSGTPAEVRSLIFGVKQDLVETDRLLALTKIEEAEALVAPNPELQAQVDQAVATARKWLERGDQDRDAGRQATAISRYYRAWDAVRLIPT